MVPLFEFLHSSRRERICHHSADFCGNNKIFRCFYFCIQGWDVLFVQCVERHAAGHIRTTMLQCLCNVAECLRCNRMECREPVPAFGKSPQPPAYLLEEKRDAQLFVPFHFPFKFHPSLSYEITGLL